MNSRTINTLIGISTILLIVFFLFYGINASIARSDESIHATVAREIAFNGGPWWRPTFFGALYLNKPPLQLWGTAFLLNVLGDFNFVYRIFPAVAGIGVFSLLFVWGRKFFGGRIAGLAAILTALTGNQVLFDHGMRVATQDASLLFLTLLAFFLIFRFLFEDQKNGDLFLGALAVGFACLVKWVAGLLPFLVFGIFCLTTKYGRAILVKQYKKIILAGLLTLLPAAVFLLPHFLSDFDTTKNALVWNISDRLMGKGYHHQSEWWHYLQHLFIKGSYGEPLVVIFGVLTGLALHNDPKIKFLMLWFIVPLILYSPLSSHLAWYFLPAVPALWLLAGKGFEMLSSRPKDQVMGRNIAGIIVCVILVMGLTQQVRRSYARQTIPLDAFVESFRGLPFKIDFSQVDISKDGSHGLTRRQIFYLNRLKTFSVEASREMVTLKPFEMVQNEKLRSPLCLRSENNRKKKLACLFVSERP